MRPYALLSSLCVLFFSSACAPTPEARIHDQELLSSLLQKDEPRIRSCYLNETDLNPNVGSGTLRLKVDQNPDGSFGTPRLIQGFSGSEPVFECIERIVQTWKTEPFYTRGAADLKWNFAPTHQRAKAPAEFRELLNAHQPEIARCFKDQKIETANLQFEFTHAKDGSIRDLKLKKGFPATTASFACMKKIMGDWKLNPQAQESHLDWTYSFRTQTDYRSSTEAKRP